MDLANGNHLHLRTYLHGFYLTLKMTQYERIPHTYKPLSRKIYHTYSVPQPFLIDTSYNLFMSSLIHVFITKYYKFLGG